MIDVSQPTGGGLRHNIHRQYSVILFTSRILGRRSVPPGMASITEPSSHRPPDDGSPIMSIGHSDAAIRDALLLAMTKIFSWGGGAQNVDMPSYSRDLWGWDESRAYSAP